MNRKDSFDQSATYRFAAQGFEATMMLQIAQVSGITQPLNYYYFSGKEEPFTQILSKAFFLYFKRLDTLPENSSTELERIANIRGCKLQTRY